MIEWEANTFGCPVWDLAFWVTETVVLEAKHMDTKTLVSTFLASYRQTAGDKIVTNKFAAKHKTNGDVSLSSNSSHPQAILGSVSIHFCSPVIFIANIR